MSRQLGRSYRSTIALRRRGSGAMLLLAALAAVVLLIGGGYFYISRTGKTTGPLIVTKEVSRGPFEHIVLEHGEIESSSNIEVICEVESRNSTGTAILWVIDEGTQVEPGDKLVELDASALDQELKQQKVIVNSAKIAMTTAISTLEKAEVAKEEYLKGIFAQEEKLILSEVLVAEENLNRAKETAMYSERLAALGFQTSLQLKADQFAVEKAAVELELAQSKLKTLRDITKKKMLIQLDADIAAAKAQVDADSSSYEEEVDKLKGIEEQIKKCVIYAPQGGVVVHANRVSSRGGNAEFVVEPGAMVRERQAIIRLPDPTKMQVKANVNEARVPLLREGLPARIRVGAFEDQVLEGRVTKVNKYAEPGNWFSQQIKEYATYIEIVKPPNGLRTGMTAEVQIYVERLPDALQIPVQALYEKNGHLYCLIHNGPNSYETRPVKIGAANDTVATITEGLDGGEKVVMNPRAHEDKMVIPDIPATTAPVEFVAATSDTPTGVPPDGRSRDGAAPAGANGSPGVAAGGAAGPGSAPGGSGGPRGPGGVNPAAMNPATMVDAAFKQFDSDSDGILSADEIAAMPEERRAGALRGDANGDGNVDRQEMMTAIQAFLQRMRENGGQFGGGGQ